MRLYKRFLNFMSLLILVVLLPLKGVASDKAPLRIAITDNYPPFTILGPDDRPFGLLVDMWEAWSKATGIPIEFVDSGWPDTIENVRKGRAEIHSGLFKNKARSEFLNFSNPIHVARTAVHFRSGDQIKLLENMQGHLTGTIAGTYQSRFLAEDYPQLEVREYDDISELVRGLLGGDIDAAVSETISIQSAVEKLGLRGIFKQSSETITKNYVYAAVVKGQSDLVETINRGFAQISRNDLSAIEQNWLANKNDHFYGTSGQKVSLTKEERDWLNKNRRARIAVSTFIAPVDIVDDSGKYTGLNADLLDLLEQRTGVDFQPEFYSKWPEIVESTLNGSVDGALSFSITEEREKNVQYTFPYAYDPIVIITRKDRNDIYNRTDLAGKQVSVGRGLAFIEEVRTDVGGDIREVESEAEGLALVARGEVDAHISTLVFFGNAQDKNFQPDLKIVNSRNNEGGALRFAIHKSQPILFNIVKKGMESLTEDELQGLRRKWLAPKMKAAPKAVLLNVAETKWLRENPVSEIATLKNWQPYDVSSSDGRHIGYHADLLKLMNKYMGTNFIPRPYEKWKDAYEQAVDGEVDGILGLSWTKPREDLFFFSTAYHYKAADLVMRQDDQPIRDWKSLDGRRIIVQGKASFIDKIKTELSNALIIEAISESDALARLSEGEGDVYLAWVSSTEETLDQLGLHITTQIDDRQGEMTIGTLKSNSIVTSIVQKSLNAIPEEEWAALRIRWLTPEEAGEVSLNAEEKAWLKKNPSVEVGTMDAWPPISFLDPKGRPQGLNVSLINMLNNKLDGLLHLHPAPFRENYEAVKNGELAAILDITPKPVREEFFNFTQNYLAIPHAFIARKNTPFIDNPRNLHGKIVALEKGFGNVKWFKENHPEVTIKEYSDTSLALDAVSRGEAEAYVGNRAVALYIVEQELLQNLQAHGRLNQKSVSLAIGTAKNLPILRNILDKALASFTDEERRHVFQAAESSRPLRPSRTVALSEAEQHWVNEHKTIRVMTGTWAPFHFMENSKAQGMALDYVKWALRNVGVEPEFVPIKWHEALSSIEKFEQVDLLPTIAYSKEREKYVLFTNEYLSYPRVIFSRNNQPFKNLYDLAGKTVAVEKSFITHKLLEKDHPEIKLLPVETTQAALEAVSYGQADAFVSNLAVGSYLSEKLGLTNLGVTGQTSYKMDIQAMGVRKDWPELVSILNKALSIMPEEEKRIIRNRWLGQEVNKQVKSNQIDLTPEELTWLRTHPKIRVQNEKSFAPFNFYEAGRAKGFSIEYMNLLAEKIGVEIEYISGPSWNDFLTMIEGKTLDVMLNIVQTSDRNKYIEFTNSYTNNPPMIVAQAGSDISSFEDLDGRNVCVPKGFFYQEIIERKYPNIQLVLSENQADCLEMVSAGRADANLGGLAIQDYLIKKLFLTNLKIVGSVSDEAFSNELRIGVRNDWPILRNILQKAMDAVTEEEIVAVRSRWIGGQSLSQLEEKSEGDLIRLLWIIGGLAIGLILLLTLVRILIARLSKRDISKAYHSREVKGTGLLLVGAFLTIVIVAAWITALKTEAETRAVAGDRLRTVLDITHEAVLSWVKAESRHIERIARDPDLVNYVEALVLVDHDVKQLRKSDALRDIREWFDVHGGKNDEQGFFIIAPDKISIGSKRNANIGTVNLIAKTHGARLAKTFEGETQFIPPIASDVRIKNTRNRRQTSEATMFFTAPILNDSNQVIAVLALRYDPAKDFSRIAQLGRTGATGESYFFDRDGVMLTDSRYDHDLQSLGLLERGHNAILNLELRDPGGNLLEGQPLPEDLSTLPLNHMAKDAVQGNHGSNVEGYRDYRGVSVLGEWRWDHKLDIGLVTEIDEEEALSTFETLKLTMAILLGVTVAVALGLTGLSVWIGQSANRSLRKARDNLEKEVLDRTIELNFQKFALDKHAIVSATDALGNINYVNEKFVEITGYSEDELLGQNHRMLKSGNHSQEFYQEMWQTITAGDVWHGELCNRNKDGGLIWLAASIIPFMNEKSQVERFISIRTDITKRKEAERRTQDSETRMRSIIDNAVDGIIVINSTGQIQSFSPAAERIFGYSEDEVIGQNIKKLMPERTSVEHDGYLTTYLGGAEPKIVGTNREVVGMRKDGQEFPMDLAIGETIIGEEHIFTGIIRDITTRKEAEDELEAQKNQMQDILSNVHQGIVLFDSQKRILTWNEQYPGILNIEPEILYSGMPLYDLALHLAERGEYGDEESAKELAQKRVDALSMGETRNDMAFGDGHSYDVHSIPTSDGRLVIAYTDITERKRAQGIIESSMRLIHESISYASRIQRSVLPTDQQLSEIFHDHFLIWEPKDIVGGDICLLRQTKSGPLIGVVDCTGHGVPGAFMTMVVTGALDQALIEYPDGDPALLLYRVNQLVKTILNQIDGADDKTGSDDGFECGFCLINQDEQKMIFAGARFELWHLENEDFTVIKGDKVGIGYRATSFTQAFQSKEISIDSDVAYYMCSDGIVDQVGGDRRRGYGKRRLKAELIACRHQNLEEQKDHVLFEFSQFQGEEERRDDISFLGFKLKEKS